ncbi:hypothetical protein [Hyperthermus butylicus]|uniref:Conserved archaeal protein n=1 Tax=Hyperthermus butylicus (strain DSM 5456 / JCM 9403 / PLM1-5) TaxID=415426 RepID=A2BML3_HYPBU|nr:hypothetical protein [Hyperthermus butylicus]ABM81224.1 conserved archaeal protein [Hyperthermus butylicus DSM 5456]
MIILALFVVLLLPAIAEAFTRLANYTAAPGIVLEFKFLKPTAKGFTTWEEPARGGDIIAMIHVEAVAPAGIQGDFIPLYTGAYHGKPIYLPSSGMLGDIAKAWVKEYTRRGSNPDTVYSGLLVFVSVLNRTALKHHDMRNAVIYSTVDVVSYKPAAIAAGKTLKYTINVIVDRKHRNLEYRVEEMKGLLETMAVKMASDKPRSTNMQGYQLQPQNPEESWYCDEFSEPIASYCWRRELYIAPGHLTGILPSDYFRWENGKLYVKTPLMIVYNKYSYSDTITANINLGSTNAAISIYATFGAGEGLVELFRGEKESVPELTIWKSGDRIWGGEKYYYSRAETVPPEHWWWAWIWGRPVFAVYREYYCLLDCEPLSNSYVIAAVTDVITEGSIIEGGEEKSKPAEPLMSYLFEGIELTSVGTLNPGDSLPLGSIFNTFDTCGADFEIGIPVGAIVGGLLGGPEGAAIGSVFGVSVSAEGAKIYILGGIENEGNYNVPEYIWVGASKLKYRHEQCWLFFCQTCYYNVLIGIYVEAR